MVTNYATYENVTESPTKGVYIDGLYFINIY